VSQESLTSFYETLSRDESLKAKLQAIVSAHPEQTVDESQRERLWENEILPLAKSEGFDFTLADVKALQAAERRQTGPLADEELDAVVGGRLHCLCFVIGGGKDENSFCICSVTGHGGGVLICATWGIDR